MTTKQINNLKKNLQEYSREIADKNNIDLQKAISIIVSDLENCSKNTLDSTIDEINDIIGLIEKNDTDSLNEKYPKLQYDDLSKMIDAGIDVNVSAKPYTIVQLKVIYFLLTKDKNNNAVKTKKKRVVLEAVQEVILDRKRNISLRNI